MTSSIASIDRALRVRGSGWAKTWSYEKRAFNSTSSYFR